MKRELHWIASWRERALKVSAGSELRRRMLPIAQTEMNTGPAIGSIMVMEQYQTNGARIGVVDKSPKAGPT